MFHIIFLSHTVIKAEGTDHVTDAVIAQVDSHFSPIPGTEQHLNVDTICIAVGLSPMSQLSRIAGCEMLDSPGGLVPKVDAVGDVAGSEEASSAMLGGRIAGLAAALRSGYLDQGVL